MSDRNFVASTNYWAGTWTVYLYRRDYEVKEVCCPSNYEAAQVVANAINYDKPHAYEDRVLEILLEWEAGA